MTVLFTILPAATAIVHEHSKCQYASTDHGPRTTGSPCAVHCSRVQNLEIFVWRSDALVQSKKSNLTSNKQLCTMQALMAPIGAHWCSLADSAHEIVGSAGRGCGWVVIFLRIFSFRYGHVGERPGRRHMHASLYIRRPESSIFHRATIFRNFFGSRKRHARS